MYLTALLILTASADEPDVTAPIRHQTRTEIDFEEIELLAVWVKP